MKLTPVAERLAVELLHVPPDFTTGLRGWDSSTQPSACKANSLIHCATAAAVCWLDEDVKYFLFQCIMHLVKIYSTKIKKRFSDQNYIEPKVATIRNQEKSIIRNQKTTVIRN